MNNIEWEKFKINKVVENLYEKNGFFGRYGFDIFISIVLIIIFIVLIAYIYILNNLQLVKTNWAKERCNPIYMPFAGIINGKTSGMSRFKYTLENFNYCIQGLSKDTASYALEPYNFMTYLSTHLLSSFTDALSSITAFFSRIIDSIIEYLKDAYLTLISASIEFLRIGIKIKDSFAKIGGVITATFYTLILQMNATFLWIINVPKYTAATILIGAIVTTIIAGLDSLLLQFCIPFGCGPAWWAAITLFLTGTIMVGILTAWLVIITAFTNKVFNKVKVVGMPIQL